MKWEEEERNGGTEWEREKEGERDLERGRGKLAMYVHTRTCTHIPLFPKHGQVFEAFFLVFQLDQEANLAGGQGGWGGTWG